MGGVVGWMLWTLISLTSLIRGATTEETVQKDKITESGKQKLTAICRRPDQCNSTDGVFGFDIDDCSVIDANRKILMEFTPKASCTSAVVGFFKTMGLEHEVDYSGWPHDFRDNFQTNCGHATPCHYLDPQWYRWKVVRNPYDRAVSGYLTCMIAKALRPLLPLPLVNASFETFIDYLLLLPPKDLHFFLWRHAGPQNQAYERHVYENHLPPIFNVVVKVEESEIGLQKIFEETGVKYDLKHISPHYRKRDHRIQRYVGNVSWMEVKDQIPQDYGYFYSKELMKKVELLYRWDLVLYNYTYPFFIPTM